MTVHPSQTPDPRWAAPFFSGRKVLVTGGTSGIGAGIAKGFAVDALSALLREQGCRHVLVEIGGELLGLGLRPDGDPWWVDLETPASAVAPLRVALHQLLHVAREGAVSIIR